jgi:hypothetical protein
MRFALLPLVLAFASAVVPAAPAALTVRTPVEDETWVAGADTPRSVVWDVTGLVRSGVAGEWPNGVLLKLTDGDEDFGPYMPSMSFSGIAEDPRLVLAYGSPTGTAR